MPGKVVKWDQTGSKHSPGPNFAHYERARKECGAHLVFNAFWSVQHFCVYHMVMRDSMHAIDLGVIITLLKAILRKYYECVEKILNIEGRAAAKLERRFRRILARWTGPDGQR